MISPLQMRAMRVAMQEKLATRDVHGREFEEMTKAKWKQMAKDLPVVALGSGLGYATGKELARQAAKHMAGTSPKTRQFLNYAMPMASTMVSATGAYALGRQRELLRQRREEAERLAQANKKSR
jgi:hypothetical protein